MRYETPPILNYCESMDEWGTGLVLEDNHFGVSPGESILVYRDLGHRHLTDFALDFGIHPRRG